MSEKIKGKIFGIDLGTTNSCISLFGESATVIPNSEGANTTPSIIGYKDANNRVVGSAAKRQSVINPTNTLYRTKSFIGVNFDEVSAKLKSYPLPYEVVKAKNGGVEFKLGCGVTLNPSECGAAILQELAKSAERYYGQPVKNVVITVPAYFNDSQRQATKDAGAIAGLNVVRIINEPTAAALAYGLEKIKKDCKIAVYDLGGGTFDISILEVTEDGIFKVISTNGDTHLGGEDFDEIIVKHINAEFSKETGIDLLKENNKESLQRLREGAEKAKIALSSQNSTEINLPFITANASGPKHLNVSLTRAKFESLIDVELKKTEKCCLAAIKDAQISTSEIEKVLLVGGSTRIPAVQHLVEKIFGKKPSCDLNPDEVVAVGAAVQGAILSGDVTDILLLDVIPLSLGIETLGGVMSKLVERNTTIPVRKSQVFSTAADNQTSVSIRVFQGEREMANANKCLGQFDLHGIPPAARGIPQIEVSFDVDANGILKVSAKEKNTGKEQSITIQGSSGLSKEEVEQATKDAEMHAESDRQRKELIDLRNNADNLIYTTEKALKENQNIEESLKTSITEKMSKLQGLMSSENKQELQEAYDDLNGELTKVYQSNQQANQEANPENAEEKTE